MISNRTEYAIRALAELAKADGSMKSNDIARLQRIPPKFLPHILSDLAKSGLIRTSRGFGGGIRLNVDPRRITFRSVVEAVQGPIVAYECLIGPTTCQLEDCCNIRLVWKQIQGAVEDVLNTTTLHDIISENGNQTEVKNGDQR